MPIKLDQKQLDKELRRIMDFFDYTRSTIMSVAAIENIAGVPKNTLLNFLKAGRRLPQKHIFKIVDVLEKFGYQAMFDWSWIESEYS